MAITQIPFQDPVAPPEKPEPEQLSLYSTRTWVDEDVDRDLHIPHLVIQLQDDLARSRKREAAWISIIAHLLLAILLFSPLFDMLQKAVGWHSASVVPLRMEDKDTTFLALPPDLQKAPRRPNTHVLSDKDRIAMSRHPDELKKALVTPPPGRPGPPGPRAAQPATAPQAAPQQAAPQQQQQAMQRPQFDSNQQAQLTMPAHSNANPFKKYEEGMSAGSAIQQATAAAAARRGGGGDGGDFGLGTGARGRQQGALDILSDTQGVDFGPYLQRILQDVRENWYHLIPPSAEMKKGKLAIEFAITKDGKVADMRLVASSGDVALDRPAWGSITASNPFPPLPNEFTGPFLALRFRFYYNPDKADLE